MPLDDGDAVDESHGDAILLQDDMEGRSGGGKN